MVNVVKRGAGRPGHTARTNRHAQRTPLPPKAGVVEDAREAVAEATSGLCPKDGCQRLPGHAGRHGKRTKAEQSLIDATPVPDAAPVEPNKIDSQSQEGLQKNATKPGDSKSWGKAVAFQTAVTALGWSTEVDYAQDGEDDDIVEVLASRGDEHLYISWVAGSLRHPVTYTIGDRTVKMRNASQAKQYAGRPAEAAQREMTKVQLNKSFRRKAVEPKRSKILFDIAVATDEEIIAALLGKTVAWHNSQTQGTETGTFGTDAKRVQIKPAKTDKPEDRIVAFCCRVSGFRAFKLSALTRVGGSHRRVVRGALPKGAGAVRCEECAVTARADGKGSPIVLRHKDGCSVARELQEV